MGNPKFFNTKYVIQFVGLLVFVESTSGTNYCNEVNQFLNYYLRYCHEFRVGKNASKNYFRYKIQNTSVLETKIQNTFQI